jgi:hypothetical protein
VYLAQEERKQREALKVAAAASSAADERKAAKAAAALLAQEQAEAQQKGQKVCALPHPDAAVQPYRNAPLSAAYTCQCSGRKKGGGWLLSMHSARRTQG